MAKQKQEKDVVVEESDKPTNNQGDDPIKNLLGSLLKGNKDDHYNFIENESIPFSTGSLLLDTHVKLKSGCVVRLAGPLESGKTSQSLLILANYLKTVPQSRGLYIKAEGRLSEELRKRSGLKFVFSEEEWDYGTVFVLESNVFEVVCDFIQALLRNMYDKKEKLGFIIDSLDGLILKKDLEKSAVENVQPAGVPKMTKMFFRRLALAINKYDALALLTSQYSETFKIDMYAKDKPQPVQGSGGSAVSHQPDWILEYGVRYNNHYILEDEDAKPDAFSNKTLGHWVSITLRKTTNETTGTNVKIPIKRGQTGSSIWVSKEIGDIVLQWDLAKKNKNTFEFDDDIIKQAKADNVEIKKSMVGKNRFYSYFEDNKDVCDWFLKKFKSIYS